MHLTQLAPDLYATPPFPVGELDGGANTRAYLLTRPHGNVLIYGLGFNRQEAEDAVLDEIADLGGVQLQILSHADEASPACDAVRTRFGGRLACSAADHVRIAEFSPGLEVDFTWSPDTVDEALTGVEVLATPGHSAGSISLRYASPHGQTYLFTGDTIVPKPDGWVVAVAEGQGGTAEDLEASLKTLRGTEFDLLASSAFVGDVSTATPSHEEWQAIVDRRLERLEVYKAARLKQMEEEAQMSEAAS